MNQTEYTSLKKGQKVYMYPGSQAKLTVNSPVKTGVFSAFIKHTKRFTGIPKVQVDWSDNTCSVVPISKLHILAL